MEPIELYLSPYKERGQTLENGLDPNALAHTTDRDVEAENFLLDGDPNSIAEQSWTVIAPDNDRGTHLLQVIKPLLDKRSRDMEGRPVEVFRVPPDMTAAQAANWKDVTYAGNKDPLDIPVYVTVLGDFSEVSIATQRVLSNKYLVGRIGFETDDDYESYVAKLLHWEGVKREGRARAMFFTARDGTPATLLGDRVLMQPSLVDARKYAGKAPFPVSEVQEITGDDPTAAGGLLVDAAKTEQPSFLFSCSHGMGAPRRGWNSVDKQRALQGALCLGDGEYIAAEDLKTQPFLPGGLWMFFACFGAGTPDISEYAHWLSNLKGLGKFSGSLSSVMHSLPQGRDKPFIAALPKAVLANPDGPLAVVGHVDLAWSYSFQDMDKKQDQGRHRRFQNVYRWATKGHNIGYALTTLFAHRADIQTEITISEDMRMRERELGEEIPDDRLRMGHRWMLHQDLDGYVLLGDPAAHMAVNPKSPETASDSWHQPRPRSYADLGIEIVTTPPAEKPEEKPEEKPAPVQEPTQAQTPATDEAMDFGLFGRDKDKDEDKRESKGEDRETDKDERPGFLARITQSLSNALGNFVEDAATLEVKTFIADNLSVRDSARLADNPDVRLFALTRSKLDGDIEQVWSSTAVDADNRELRTLHLEMVKQAESHRYELLRMLFSLFKRD